MRFITSALLSEGVSDDRFLPRVLTRALEELCATDFDEFVDIGEVTVLRHRSRPPTVEEALELLEAQAGSFLLVFFHRDQDGRSAKVDKDWLEPLSAQWARQFGRLVPVVPVRKTEAWMLADGDALRASLGVRWPDRELGVPETPALVERIQDPKLPLRKLGTRLSRPVDSYFERLGEEVSIELLCGVPAFQRWWKDTRASLTELGLRRRPS